MRLLFPVAVVALAGVATASYAPPVPHTSHYGDGGGGGAHFRGGGSHVVGGGPHISGGGSHAVGGGPHISGGGRSHGVGGGSHFVGGSHPVGGGVQVGGSGYGSGGPYGNLFLSFLSPETRYYDYTWSEAAYQCASRGLVLVSIENYEKDHYIASLLRRYNVKFIWTSGTKRGYSFSWVTGQKITSYSYTNWSRTGLSGRPQPDNREGNEYCLAILNNFYHDGIKWHDIGCHHRKAFICEPPKQYY